MPEMPGMTGPATMSAVQGGGAQDPTSGLSGQTEGLIGANINPITGAAIKPGFFGQGGMAQVGLGAIQTLGSLWNSFQQNKIAKKSLNLQEKTFETNLANQTKSYNTELEDRIRTRYDSERRDPSEADSYIDKNKL
ncbi:MAG: hypothetical protein LC687_06510 [Actinobacteria bacterium]|nr:hypothetical protein [Actinomycetota bacterium]